MKILAIILSGCIGYLSLSQEILWMRWVSFFNQGIPQTFSLVLCIFLFGIALGAEIGKLICEKNYDLVAASAWILLLAALTDISIILIRNISGNEPWLYFTFMIMASASCKGMLFPIAHHLGTATSRRGLGVSVSTVYFSNIVGSTLGPLITGFVVLDYVGLRQAFLLIGLADLVLAFACFVMTRYWTAVILIAAVSTPILSLWFGHNSLLIPAKQIVENRHGIIYVLEDGRQGDIIYGGNVYDGRINTSLIKNSNGVDRVFVLAALHPSPKRILVIGLSGGSWTKILSGFQGVERIDVVEINPGYLEIIQNYAEVADILRNPKIHIFIDDGRRWLKRNPQGKYDLIVMNTTFHWRNFTSNLLSIKFLRLLRGRMNPDAIVAFNTTNSMDAFKTAISVFRYAYLYKNFILAGEQDFRTNLAHGFNRISQMRWSSLPVFNLEDGRDMEAIHRVLSVPFQTFSEIQQSASRQYEVITEQNMITEYKYGVWRYPWNNPW